MTLFYDNLHRICEERNTSISATVKAIGLDKSTGSNWKKRQSPPDDKVLKQLAEQLRCNVSDFFAEPHQARYSSDVEMMEAKIASGEWEYAKEPALDEYQRDFMRIYSSLTAKDRMLLMHQVYGFADEKGVEL